MKTGFSLCSIFNREKPFFINWEPCNENRFFPVCKYYTVKTLFWPCTGPVLALYWSCTGPVRDCIKQTLGQFSVHKIVPAFVLLKNPGQHIFFWDFLTFSTIKIQKSLNPLYCVFSLGQFCRDYLGFQKNCLSGTFTVSKLQYSNIVNTFYVQDNTSLEK